jgi:hypothetical protein
VATKQKARREAGRKNSDNREDNKPSPEIQEVYSEEILIGAALVNWEGVSPHSITNDFFTDPALREIWNALAANPRAGTAAIPKDLQARAVRAIELYNYEDPGAVIAILLEARNARTLETAAEKLLHPKPNEKAATTWARVKRYVDEADVTPPIETTRWTPDTLAAAKFPEPEWLIPNLLPSGITLLAGRPKTGKSWLALLWGSQIEGGTIYAAYEDNERRLKNRTETLEIKGNNLILIPSPPWRMPEALDELAKDVNGNDPSTVIIDPWTYFSPPLRDNRRIYDVDYDALAQLRRWADNVGVSVVIIHHSRKPTPGQRGDFLDEPLGSTALTGAVDTVAVLKRKNDTEAILHLRGRDVQEKELALTFDAGLWNILGNAREVIPSGARADIIAVLKEAGKPLPPADVAKRLDEPRDNVKVVLSRMYHASQLHRDDKGRYTPVTTVTDVTEALF